MADSSFNDALQRAREVAAKIATPGNLPPMTSYGLKRPSDGPEPEQKRSAFDNNVDVQLSLIKEQQRQQATATASAVAARINSTLGIPGQPNVPVSHPPPNMPNMIPPESLRAAVENFSRCEDPFNNDFTGGAVAGQIDPVSGHPIVTDDWKVPDRMVGLIIGKQGETIQKIRAETGARLQIAQENQMGSSERVCQITGTQDQIARCKSIIHGMIYKGQTGGIDSQNLPHGHVLLEVMVPGPKVGLIIGKGGENIRNLQDQCGVKMVMVQDSSTPTATDKPLRITGPPEKCNAAKEMVIDLLAQKEMEQMKQFAGGAEYGGQPALEVPVPRGVVGVIIGKGGEKIKKVQSEVGIRIQFKPDDNVNDRVAQLFGPPQKQVEARRILERAIQEALERNAEHDRRGGGGGPGGGGGGMGVGGGGPGGGGGARFGRFDNHHERHERVPGGPYGIGSITDIGGGEEEYRHGVPQERGGIVIGKGGENIRAIMQETGTTIRLANDVPPNCPEKVFCIRGKPEQIQQAINAIDQKAGQSSRRGFDRPPMNGGGGGGQTAFGPPPTVGPPPVVYPGLTPPSAVAGQAPPAQPWPGYGQAPANSTQYPPPATQPQQQQQPGAVPGAIPTGAPAPAPGQPGADGSNSAAWSAYYAQMYGGGAAVAGGVQPGQPAQQPTSAGAGAPALAPPGVVAPVSLGQPMSAANATAAYPPSSSSQPTVTSAPAAPAVNPVTGAPDYSQQWADYYRAQGQHQYADAILAQARQQQTQAGAPAVTQPGVPQPQQQQQVAQVQQPPQQQPQQAQPQMGMSQPGQMQQMGAPISSVAGGQSMPMVSPYQQQQFTQAALQPQQLQQAPHQMMQANAAAAAAAAAAGQPPMQQQASQQPGAVSAAGPTAAAAAMMSSQQPHSLAPPPLGAGGPPQMVPGQSPAGMNAAGMPPHSAAQGVPPQFHMG